MVLKPKQQSDIKSDIEDHLRSNLNKITNFASSSFNDIFLSSFSDALYEYQIRLLAAQLSGWVDYAGGPITQNDLDRLGLDEFDDLSRLNDFMRDEQLDNLGAIVGISRDKGSKATGSVTITTFDSQTPVPDGLQVSTQGDANTESKVFEVDIDSSSVTPADQNNTDTVSVSIVATEPGDEYNVGSGTITRFISPPPGIESVNNPSSTTGGVDREDNASLRDRIKNAVFESSGGGTAAGVRGFIEQNVNGVSDVLLEEFVNESPTNVDVIVDGGTDADVTNAIESARPTGVEHNLVRPATFNLGITVETKGADVDAALVKDKLEDYVFDLGLGENFIEDKAKQAVLNVEPNIDNIVAFNVRVIDVVNWRTEYNNGTNIYQLPEFPLGRIDEEEHYYESSKNIYDIDAHPIESGSETVEILSGGTWSTVSDTEYSIIDNDGDGMLDSIDWSTGSTTPNDGGLFRITYDLLTSTSETFTYDGSSEYALTYIPALASDSTVTDAGGDTYTLGTDYDIVDTNSDSDKDALKWLSGGSTPASSENFTVNYEVDVGSIREITGTLNGNSATFTEGTDFNETDNDNDGYDDAVDWSVGGDSPDDTTDFSVDFSAQSDVLEDYAVENREKLSAIVDEVVVTTYE